MEVRRFEKPAFSVVGMEGSTQDGEGFVQRLWQLANGRFAEVEGICLRDENGGVAAIWGAMSDENMRFLPWEEGFSKGRYLAGVEVKPDALPPEGWVKWNVPGFAYLAIPASEPDAFQRGLELVEKEGHQLAGAVQELYLPGENGRCFLCYPIRKLN